MPEENSRPAPEEQGDSHPATIAAIGASAGGLEAFTQLLKALPDPPGLAIVLIQHLASDHESALPYLLRSATRMPVDQVQDGVVAEANHVYVIPPGSEMYVEPSGRLRLLSRRHGQSPHMPIDLFFRSLAEAAGHRAVGAVLSGTGSDGTVGLREIKGAGGITLAHDPETTKDDGMPRAAIAQRVVDLVLTPAAMAEELDRIGRHPYARGPIAEDPTEGAGEAASAEEKPHLQQLCDALRTATGVDFSHYKPGTINRRLHRRMALQRVETVPAYVDHILRDREELERLYHDLLIPVTRFFRDAPAFERLKEVALPEILANRGPEEPLRVWVPACSTGEDAYSTAMVLLEHLGDATDTTPVRIFGTDVSDTAVAHARNASYPRAIAHDVSADRLRRFFAERDGRCVPGPGRLLAAGARPLCVLPPRCHPGPSLLPDGLGRLPERPDLPRRDPPEAGAQPPLLCAEADGIPRARVGGIGRAGAEPVHSGG